MDQKKVSVIIPVKEINDYILESYGHLMALDFQNFEVLVFPDRDAGVRLNGVRIIPTGPLGPAEKRDLAIKYAEGEILAFLDDDAYPRRDWLTNAVIHFKDESIAAVGGPAVTPESDSVMRQASGAVFSSRLTSSSYTYRYLPEYYREVDDFPTVNLFIRKSVFESLGGFDTNYWPGEDTKLCLDITKKLGLKIVYDPEVFVYHHRRALFREHLRQVSRYACQRGYFVKEFPETSLKPGYFIPSAFLLFLLSGPLVLLASKTVFVLWSALMLVYLSAVFLASISAMVRHKNIAVGLIVFPGIFLTHITYGFYFLKGLLSRKRGMIAKEVKAAA